MLKELRHQVTDADPGEGLVAGTSANGANGDKDLEGVVQATADVSFNGGDFFAGDVGNGGGDVGDCFFGQLVGDLG